MVELHFARLQTALFLTSLDTVKKLDLAMAIRSASGGLLDADPLMLPIPPNAPPELPRLQLRSGDGHWVYQVTGNRLDFVFEPPFDKLGDIEFADTIQRQAQINGSIWDAIQAEYSASGSRIGIVSLFVSLPGDPVRVLQTRFMQPSNAPTPHQLQLHALHKMVLGEIPINRWVRCIAGELPLESGSQDSLRVEIDVNTLPERHFGLGSAAILGFADKVKGLVLNTAASLFEDTPSGERIF